MNVHREANIIDSVLYYGEPTTRGEGQQKGPGGAVVEGWDGLSLLLELFQ